MRAIVSAVLLLMQVQPLTGVVLCQVLTGGTGERMEAGCPMPGPRASALLADEPDSGDLAGIREADPNSNLPGEPHDCVLTESCLTTTPAVLPPPAGLVFAISPSDLAFPVAASLHSAGPRAPPVPPPDS